MKRTHASEAPAQTERATARMAEETLNGALRMHVRAEAARARSYAPGIQKEKGQGADRRPVKQVEKAVGVQPCCRVAFVRMSTPVPQAARALTFIVQHSSSPCRRERAHIRRLQEGRKRADCAVARNGTSPQLTDKPPQPPACPPASPSSATQSLTPLPIQGYHVQSVSAKPPTPVHIYVNHSR